MYWHLILTEKCNSKCRYCYEKSLKEFDNGLSKKFDFEFNAPCDSEINLLNLKKFLEQDKNPVIIFYGGEPLLQIKKIKKIMDFFNESRIRFCIQTNGKLLNNLPKEYLKRFSKILISLDGEEKITDFNRGMGTYKKVIENIEKIRKNNFNGEIIARMTIAHEFPEIFSQVRYLLDLKVFDSVHWQIDAGFYKNDFSRKNFTQFVKEYNNSVEKLVDWWISEIQKRKIHKIYPFLGILNRVMGWDKQKGIMCGAGQFGYAITTNGKIAACPIMNNIKNFYCGDLNSNINKLKKISPIEPCKNCLYLAFCGGRCLYSNYAKLWPKEGQELICQTIKHLIIEIKKISPKIKDLIKKNVFSEKDFYYEKYFGPEIIP
jgi:uncharacterized protein